MEVQGQHRLVDELIRLIVEKLEANRPALEKSLHSGRLSWRTRRPGKIEVNLEPRL